jgi:nucleotide-binding universal stress UspA family protein
MEKGRKQYGHGLIQNSGYDWVKEALEEALDLSIYLSAKLIEVKNLEAKNHVASESELSKSL